jgi:hypothetical protein
MDRPWIDLAEFVRPGSACQAEAASPAGQSAIDPLGAVASAPRRFISSWAFCGAASVDRKPDAYNSALVQIWYKFKNRIFLQPKYMSILMLNMVEAAGVEPDISVENTQLTDSGNASFAGNAMISKSTVQTLYKLFLEFPERQSTAFPSWRRRRILKRS